MSSPAFPKPDGQDRSPPEMLESWKEIAAHLGRSVRAVQKWEKEEGLPIHRHQHERQGTVYAYPSELDAWLKSRSVRPEAPAGRKASALWIGAGMAVLALVAIALVMTRPRSKPVTVAFGERDWVLISSVENRTGLRSLDGVLEHFLARELAGSRYVNVVPAERIGDALQLMRRSRQTSLDRALAQEIALRDGGIRLVAGGRLDRVGDRLVLSVDLIDPRSGETAVALDEEADSMENVVPAARRLAARIRTALGEPRPTAQSGRDPLERVTTPSLQALRLFSSADSLIFHDNAAAEQLLREAIREDPDFASAHMHLAHALHNQQKSPAEVLAAAKRASELSGRTADRERLFIAASYHSMTGDMELAVTHYKALLELYPDHFWALNNLSGILKFKLNRGQEAAPYRVRMAEVRPHEFVSNFAAADSLAFWLDRPGDAEPYYRRALALLTPSDEAAFPDLASWVKLHGAEQAWLRGDAQAGLAELQRWEKSLTSPAAANDFLIEDISWLYLAFGRAGDARRAGALVRNPLRRARHAASLAFESGDMETAARLYRDLAKTGWRPSALEEARLLLLRLPVPSRPADPNQRDRHVRQAAAAFASGRHADAIPSLRQGNVMRTIGPRQMQGWLLQAEMLASHLASEGNIAEAVTALERASEQRGRTLPDSKPGWLRIRGQLLQMYRLAGNQAGAAMVEGETRRILRLADEEFRRGLDGRGTFAPRSERLGRDFRTPIP
ncbi:MAG TPA: tetratricopeptide repeat protein [Thermoanaerobaculia bacterium]|nr:tetratricopeptide repeat protein [Thermoanaerobaculia bacterium]